jgi:CelD/BcsL family acetyltransferase involved in cellulose biosynthesis
MYQILEINQIGELEEFRLPWKLLHSKTRRASLFQTLDWLQLYWETFGAEQKLRVFMVYRGTEITGVMPLVVRREPTKLGSVRVLTYPLQDWGSFFGPIGPSPASTLYEVFRYLRDADRDWDVIEPRWIDKEVVDFGRTAAAMREADFRPIESVWKEIALIEFGANWDEYWLARSSKFRENVRRGEKKIEASYAPEFIRYRPHGEIAGDDDPRWDLFDQVVDVAGRGWQGDSTDGTTLCHVSVAPFFRAVHELAARLGMLDLTLLRLKDRPVAFMYNYHHAGYVNGIRMGFDAEMKELGIGRHIQYLSFKDAAERGDHTIDLGPDYFDAKKPWMTRVATSHRCSHYTMLSPKAQLLGLKRWWSERSAAGKAKSVSG